MFSFTLTRHFPISEYCIKLWRKTSQEYGIPARIDRKNFNAMINKLRASRGLLLAATSVYRYACRYVCVCVSHVKTDLFATPRRGLRSLYRRQVIVSRRRARDHATREPLESEKRIRDGRRDSQALLRSHYTRTTKAALLLLALA